MEIPPDNAALAEAKAQFDAAREDDAKKIGELEASVSTLTDQLATANARADKAEKAHRAATAKVTRLQAEPTPRKLGPIAEGKHLDRDALKGAIGEAEKVEIAFSDGRREVAGTAPVQVEGDSWRDHPHGLMLDQPVEIAGRELGGASFQIAGYALLLDGHQVAFTRRSDPLTVSPGNKLKLERDIFF